MKRKLSYLLAILLIILLVLTGCGKEENKKTSKKESNSEVVEEKEEAPVDWQSLYLQAFKDGKIVANAPDNMKIQFVDVDSDKIPEMYYSYIAESSEQYRGSANNADGKSIFTGSARIYVDSEGNGNVSSSNSGESTYEKAEGYEFAFVHLLPTDEYLWAYTSSGAEFNMTSKKDGQSYRAHTQRGTKSASSEVIIEFVGICPPIAVSVNPSVIDETFEAELKNAAYRYVPNDDIMKSVKDGADISDWASIYKEYITKRGIVTPYNDAKIVFVDIDDNGLVDMVYSYKDERNYVVTKVYKLTEAGNIVPIGVANGVPSYGSGYEYKLAVRYGYINTLDRNGWVLTSPGCQVLLTDDLTVDGTRTFYIPSNSDKGMAQYDAYTMCELIPESQMPGNVGKFVSIDTTKFDSNFDAAFEEAVSRYVPNKEIGNSDDEDENETTNNKEEEKIEADEKN